MFLEHPAEMLRIFKAKIIGHLGDIAASHQLVLRQSNDMLANEIARIFSGRLFKHVAEIIWRHTEFAGKILDSGNSLRQLHPTVKILIQQRAKPHQNIIARLADLAELA